MLPDRRCQQESTAEGLGCIDCAQTPPHPPQACEEEERGAEQMHGKRSRFPPPNKIWSEAAARVAEPEVRLWAAQTVDSRAARISPRSRCRSRAENPLGSQLLRGSGGASSAVWDGASPSTGCGTETRSSERRRPSPGGSAWMRTPAFWGAPGQALPLAWGARRDVNIVFPLVNPIAAPCKSAQV